jgi:dTDP-4-amino-4,6-dideoxygalactose transaminase
MSRIHLSKADVTEVEERYVLEALRSGWVAPLGPDVDAFEAEVAQRVGVAGALALSSGTAALHLALLSLGAAPGKAIILPSMTFAASANAVAYTGATPVFVDSRGTDGNVDAEMMLHAVDTLRDEGADIAGVMSVDIFGRCADYRVLVPQLEERGIELVEDAAEALGASIDGRSAGSYGRAAALSFNGNKIMTTSGGGMLLSDDLELISRARYLSTQARQPAPWYEHTEVGFNYRMSNLLAALGRGQLTRLDTMIARRREIRAQYAEALADIENVRLLGDDRNPGYVDNCWLTCIVLDPTRAEAPGVIKSLDNADIEARHLWKPMHAQPLYAGARAFVNGVCDDLFVNGVTLPSGSALSDAEVERVITELRSALGAS